MVRNFIFLALVALAVTIYALIECVRTPPHEVRSLPKAGWVAAIVLLPLIGAGLWFWLGRPKNTSDARATESRQGATGAPDDDPEFLRKLERQRRNKAREDELRRKEAELEALERKLREEGKPGDKPRDEGGNPTEDTPRHTP
ncbi:PLD nuclease N-terminal domain-containing protein [Paeniglutamicibacter sp. ABSL32-1]|uniref:PLDc N-terminal domain-containing protein n=1 Tax=Paeniglutamicibacter quisquiliarum TaxID=2849498 RepID=UPI001C2D5976|nr:PLD nuclease N-terminal domain-containing protein [Paeniglutamicibacter quisquiliarum]MBV1779774.1 PLD nuclease N-terminal domain-containing protein [Paeniglutamicibacter quisquiliarum]